MKASELRIGNWIHNNMDGKDFQVAADTLIWLARGKEMLMTNPPKPIVEPIPLTEEWLLKFGFEMEEHTRLGNGQDWQPDYPRSDYRDFIHSEFIIRYDTFTYLSTEDSPGELISLEPQLSIHLGQWTERICEPVRCPEIKYVHQLQNLYFALTGEELTIKE